MISSLLMIGVLIGSALASQSSGQVPTDNQKSPDHGRSKAAAPKAMSGNSSTKPAFGAIDFIMSRIDEAVVKEFQKAWWVSRSGVEQREGVVLLYRGVNSSLQARSLGRTNQHKSFTFSWNPNIIAIVHTHPNDADPKPSNDDKRLADRFGFPVFTITNRGMFVYDPATRKISKVRNNLDWWIPTASMQASSSN